jgi:hypothetical protein
MQNILFFRDKLSYIAKYRSKLVTYSTHMEEKKKIDRIDVKQDIYSSIEAWQEVSKQVIQNCWKKHK